MRIDWTPMLDDILCVCVRGIERASEHDLPWRGLDGERLWCEVRDAFVRTACLRTGRSPASDPLSQITSGTVRTRWSTLQEREATETEFAPPAAAHAEDRVIEVLKQISAQTIVNTNLLGAIQSTIERSNQTRGDWSARIIDRLERLLEVWK